MLVKTMPMLSHGCHGDFIAFYFLLCSFQRAMVGLNRLELLTSRLSGVRSNQLSYRPMLSWLVAIPL